MKREFSWAERRAKKALMPSDVRKYGPQIKLGVRETSTRCTCEQSMPDTLEGTCCKCGKGLA